MYLIKKIMPLDKKINNYIYKLKNFYYNELKIKFDL